MTKKLALVVHGIGEQQPGETLDDLVGAITGDAPCVVQSEERLLREKHHDHDPRKIDLFRCNIRRIDCAEKRPGQSAPDSVVFAEVFWGDLSPGGNGRFQTLIELFRVIMGLGHIVRENIEEVENVPPLVRRSATLFVYLLHGPITVLNIIFFLGTLFLYVVQKLPEVFEGQSAYAGSISVSLVAVALLLIRKIWREETQSYLFQIFWRWMGWMAYALAALVAASHAFFAWVMPDTLQAAFVTLNIRCAPIMGEGPLGCLDHWYTVLLIHTVSFVWFVCIALVAFLVLRQRLVEGRDPNKRQKTLFPATCAAMLVLWMFLAVVGWVSFANSIAGTFDDPDVLTVNLREAIGLSIFIWAAFLILLIRAGLAAFFRARWVKKNKHKKAEAGNVPRLIVHQAVRRALMWAMVVLLTGAVWFGLRSMTAWMECGFSVPMDGFWCDFATFRDGVDRYLGIAHKGTNYLALGFAAAYSVAWNKIAVGLGIAKDIVVYFVRRPEPGLEDRDDVSVDYENDVKYLLVPSKRKVDGREERYTKKVVVYPNRTRIQQRFDLVYKAMMESEAPDQVVVVSHSQGTLIALESLRNSRLRGKIGKSYIAPTLVTMGSPTTHIYQTYFGTVFPVDNTVRDGIRKWINIFRFDDFVGTRVDGPDDEWPVNHGVPPGGHTGYWTDDEVRKYLTCKDTFSEVS